MTTTAAPTIELNHTIIWSSDAKTSAAELAELLGLPSPSSFARFEIVATGNGVSLDFADAGDVHPQHYAFLVGDDDFDATFARIVEREIRYWADPGRRREGEINTHDGGRGVYWANRDGHLFEISSIAS